MNAQKESLKKTSGIHASSRMPTKKCAMKMKETNKQTKKQRRKKKRRARINVFDGRRAFIGRLWYGGLIDCKEPQADDC